MVNKLSGRLMPSIFVLKNAKSGISVKSSGKETRSSCSQAANAHPPILHPFGMVTSRRAVPSKARLPMVSNPSGRLTASRFSQPSKALSEMTFRLAGNLRERRLANFAKKWSRITLVPSGIASSVSSLPPIVMISDVMGSRDTIFLLGASEYMFNSVSTLSYSISWTYLM